MKKTILIILTAVLIGSISFGLVRLYNPTVIYLDSNNAIEIIPESFRLKNQGIRALTINMGNSIEKITNWVKEQYNISTYQVNAIKESVRITADDIGFRVTDDHSGRGLYTLNPDKYEVTWDELYSGSASESNQKLEIECTYGGNMQHGEEKAVNLELTVVRSYEVSFWKGVIPYSFTIVDDSNAVSYGITVYD